MNPEKSDCTHPDLCEVRRRIRARRFEPPQTKFIKPDPRGSDYGRFEVTIIDFDNILVEFIDGSPEHGGYAFYFRGDKAIDHFEHWSLTHA